MKNLNLFLLLAFAIFQVSCCRNFVKIADRNFEQYLIDQNLDTSKKLDGKISKIDANSIQEINIDSIYHVQNLEGTQYFKNLKILRANWSLVSKISGDCNQFLKTVECYHCKNLSDLNISKNDSLEELRFWPASQITELELGNKPKLKVIDGGESQIKNFDVGNCPKLENLQCFSWKMKELDLSKNPLLKYLNTDGDNLVNFDLSQNHNLISLEVESAKLKNFDLSNFPFLEKLDVSSTNISNLNLKNNCSNLKILFCPGLVNMKSLDLSQKSKLTHLNCDGISLPDLDLSYNPNLIDIEIVGTNKKMLDVFLYPNLEILDCSGTQISELNFTKYCDSLNQLYCQGLKIKSMDLSNKKKLKYVLIGNRPQQLYVDVDDPDKVPDTWSHDIGYIIYRKK